MRDLQDYTIFDALVDASALLDAGGRILRVNHKWKKCAAENGGDGKSGYIGRNYLDVFRDAAGESSAGASAVSRGLARVLSGKMREFRSEYSCHSPTQRRWFEFVASTIDAGDAKCLVSHRDISVRKLQVEELKQSELAGNALAALVASSPDGVISYDLDGRVVSWNAGAANMYGYTADEIIGKSLEVIYPDDWPVRISEYRDQIISGELRYFEVVRKAKNGDLKHVSVSAAPVRDSSGEVISVSNIHRDISDRIATEKKLKFVSDELNHRVKNIVAVVSAIFQLTAKGARDLEDFRSKFQSRLQSLAQTNDMLVKGNWESVSLRTLVESQLQIFSLADAENIFLEGPDVELAPEAVEAIGMALHELLTNASKHGALSKKGGRVRFRWKVEDVDCERQLVLHWREEGVEISESPKNKGFGHSVLVDNIRGAFQANVQLHFKRSGTCWLATVPPDYFTLK